MLREGYGQIMSVKCGMVRFADTEISQSRIESLGCFGKAARVGAATALLAFSLQTFEQSNLINRLRLTSKMLDHLFTCLPC